MKQKILAIDDSLTLREFIQRCLAKQSADYQIVLAKDGTEGLTLAAAEMPDLIALAAMSGADQVAFVPAVINLILVILFIMAGRASMAKAS